MAVLWKQFAKTFLRAIAKEKLPITDVVKFLRAEGIAFRYSEMLKTYRTYTRVVGRKDVYKFIPKIYRVAKNLYEKAPFKIKTPFFYEVTFQVENLKTGESEEKWGAIESQFELARSTIEKLAEHQMLSYFQEGKLKITGKALTGAFYQ